MSRFIGVMFCASAVATLAQSGGSAGVVDGNRVADYTPPTPKDRVDWVIRGTFGPSNLTAGLVTSAWGTWMNSPREYGPHWDGYGKRYVLRFANGSTGRTLEAGLGSLWGEDPRYFRATGQPFRNRIGHVLKMTVMSTGRDGEAMPAYARYIAVPGNSFLSNTWRPDSQATTDSALERIPIGFVDRLLGNAFSEFWPDLRKRLSRSKGP